MRAGTRIGLALGIGFLLPAYTVVIRHDVEPEAYKVADDMLPALADLPGQGHGVLIADRWVVTVTHTVNAETLDTVVIGGRDRAVAEVISHTGFRTPPEGLVDGDAAPMIAFLEGNHDVSLIRLEAPVRDVAPMPLYRGTGEVGQAVELYGKGATGNGLTGQDDETPTRGVLRQAENRIIGEKGRWLTYRFDCGVGALPHEGVPGSGDSGGPLVMQEGGRTTLAGLVAWKSWEGDVSTFQDAVCGQIFYGVRLSHYAGWIDAAIAAAVD